MNYSNILHMLLNSPRSVYIAVIDEERKNVLVRYSTCFLEAARRLKQDIDRQVLHKAFNNRYSVIKVSVLETHDKVLDKVEKQSKLAAWLEKYRVDGYTVLNDREAVKYQIQIVPYRFEEHYTKSEIQVYIKAARKGRKQLIGRFPNMSRANAWIDKTYPDRANVTAIIKHRSVK